VETDTNGSAVALATSSEKLAHSPRLNSASTMQSLAPQPDSALLWAADLLGRSLTICHLCVDLEKATAPNGAPVSRAVRVAGNL